VVRTADERQILVRRDVRDHVVEICQFVSDTPEVALSLADLVGRSEVPETYRPIDKK